MDEPVPAVLKLLADGLPDPFSAYILLDDLFPLGQIDQFVAIPQLLPFEILNRLELVPFMAEDGTAGTYQRPVISAYNV